MRSESLVVYPHPSWKDLDLKTIDLAWHQREFKIPRNWEDRRITLSTRYVCSYAGVDIDGKSVGVIHFPGGELDITSACRPGRKQTLSLLVAAMPLSKKPDDYARRSDIDAYLTQPADRRHNVCRA